MKSILTILFYILYVSEVCSQTPDANRVKPTYWVFPILTNQGVERIVYHRTTPCNESVQNECYPTIQNSYFLTRSRNITNRNDFAASSITGNDNRSWESVPSTDNLLYFANDTVINGVLIDMQTLALLESRQNDNDNIPVGRFHQINFQPNQGQTIGQVTTRLQALAADPTSSFTSFLNNVNLMTNNANLNMWIVGNASNSWNGINCSQYPTDRSICDALATTPGLASGDFDGGGVTNGAECTNGTSPKTNPNDDNPPINPNTGQPIICAATMYNNQLALLRMQAGVQWFQANFPINPNRIRQGASGITNNSDIRWVTWNEDQNIIFRVR